ncbi:MFS transporter [Chitinibacter tainanensis]|uniref:MFS transporter n=1 Tax=Chitinibacter tainanensis TaxID=230667 RepID=UPI00041F2283|nr:MFS transporter [Chitinibacter tainanensis]
MTAGTEQTAAVPAVSARWFLLNFVALSLLAGVGVGIAKVSTALYALHLHASNAEIGLISAAQMVGMLFMSIPVGLLLDQVGAMKMYFSGTLIAALLYCLTPSIGEAWFLLLCTALVSFCMPCRFIALNAVFMQQLNQVGETKAGWFRGCHMIGMFLLGPAIATALIAALPFGWVYQLIGISFVLTLLIAPRVLRIYQPKAVSHPGGAIWPRVRSQFGLLRRHRALQQCGAIEVLVNSSMMFYTAFIVAIAVRDFGLSASAAASLITSQGLSFILALMLLGGVAQKLGRRAVYRLGFTGGALSLCLLGLAPWGAALWVGGLLLGLALGWLQAANMTRVAQLGEDLGQGQVAGLMALIGPLGGFSGTVIGGLFGQLIHLQWLFLFFAGCFVLAAGFSLRPAASTETEHELNYQGVSQ